MKQQEQEPYEAKDIVTPDSSEARLSLLFKPYSIAFLLLLAFLLMEIVLGQLYFLTGDIHHQRGCEAITLPSFETHHFQDEPRLIGFIRPRNPIYGVIWEELNQLWQTD